MLNALEAVSDPRWHVPKNFVANRILLQMCSPRDPWTFHHLYILWEFDVDSGRQKISYFASSCLEQRGTRRSAVSLTNTVLSFCCGNYGLHYENICNSLHMQYIDRCEEGDEPLPAGRVEKKTVLLHSTHHIPSEMNFSAFTRFDPFTLHRVFDRLSTSIAIKYYRGGNVFQSVTYLM